VLVCPLSREVAERNCCILAPSTEEKPSTTKCACATFAAPAMHCNDAILVFIQELSPVTQKLDKLLHRGRRVVLDAKVHYTASNCLKRTIWVWQLWACIVDAKSVLMVQCKEALHLPYWIAIKAVDGAGARHAHGNQVAGYVSEVQINVVLNVKEAPAVLRHSCLCGCQQWP
jgi:hypothetical protein